MNMNAIKTIYKFNEQAGLLEQGYSDSRECAFPIEEALEGFDDTSILHETLTREDRELGEPYCDNTPKYLSREIIHQVLCTQGNISDVDRMDKHLDTIVFAFGSLFKLGLTPQQAMRGLEVVMAANMKKLDAGKDEHGKQQKGDNFVGPESELQKILDER